MRAFADKRESYMLLMVKGYSNYMTQALEQRRSNLLAAWQQPDPRKRVAALRSTWKKFGHTWRVANNELQTLRAKAWSQYRINISQCGGNAYDEESGGWGYDSEF